MRIRLIIFDLDGTLADTAMDTRDALNEAIRPFSSLSFSVEDAKAVMGGAEEGLMRSLRETGLDWPVFLTGFAAAYAARLTARTRLYPGVRQALVRLSTRRKIVFSNKSESLTAAILAHFHLLPYFEAVLGGDSGSGRKPSPEPILQILSQTDESPGETLMVGDSVYDIAAGRAAGVRTVAVTYGYGVGDFAAKADFVVDRLSQLVDLVEALERT